MNTHLRIRTAILGIGLALAAAPATAVSLIDGGSMTGDVGNNILPSPWTKLSMTPDTNSISTFGGFSDSDYGRFGATPSGVSPDGGTYVSIAATYDDRYLMFTEKFGQTVDDLELGKEYELSWFAANFGWLDVFNYAYDNYNLGGANAFEVFLDDMSIGSGDTLALDSGWYEQSLTFVATKTSYLLSFSLRDKVNSYLSIDGIALKEVAPIPLPASLPLLLAGVGGLALLRRRARG